MPKEAKVFTPQEIDATSDYKAAVAEVVKDVPLDKTKSRRARENLPFELASEKIRARMVHLYVNETRTPHYIAGTVKNDEGRFFSESDISEFLLPYKDEVILKRKSRQTAQKAVVEPDTFLDPSVGSKLSPNRRR